MRKFLRKFSFKNVSLELLIDEGSFYQIKSSFERSNQSLSKVLFRTSPNSLHFKTNKSEVTSILTFILL